MNIKPSERKQGLNTTKYIGYWQGELKYVNPTAEQLKKIYSSEEDIEEPAYQGKKDDKDWALLTFIFEEGVSKIPVSYRIFLSKDIAEFEKDGVTKTWYINQHGESQLVSDKKDLFRSFTHLQKWDDDAKKMVDALDENGNPLELQWRKAYKGETSLYGLLRKLVTQDWFQADQDTTLFIKIDELMRGKVSSITNWIGTENYRSVVGCIEIAAKDGDNGTNYYQNCVDGAWMPGWRIKDANLTTAANIWNKYEEKANGKGKNRDMYQFYQAVKRNKNITELKSIHEFNPDDHLQAGSGTISHSQGNNDGEVTMDYDI